MAIVSNTAAVNPRYRQRSRLNVLVMGLSLFATGIGLFFLAAILLTLLVHGLGALSLSVFTETTPAPQSEGGLSNAIWGSIRMTLVGMLLGTPIGILAGTYLAEYSRGTRLGSVIQFINDVLLSAPSIIIGLFVYQVVVVNQHHFSGWAGGLALAILVIPVVTRTSVDMLNLVPNGLREAAAAIGTPKWRIVTQICYRAALQGMMTGVLLAFARISGETAPLLFTALNNQFGSDMNHEVASLPIVIFQFALSPYENWKTLAWGGALLIAAVILVANILARSLSSLGRSKQ